MGRTRYTVPALCFGLAVVLALLAIAAFTSDLGANPGWFFVTTASFCAYAGGSALRSDQEFHHALAERQSQNELLSAQVREQERAVDSLADGLDVAVFICDPRGIVLYANRRACELFGSANPLGQSILAVTLSYELQQIVLRAGKEQTPQNQQITFSYPDERVGLAKAWSSDPHQVFLSVYEITDLRRLERVRQDFVANVSHELRTPMTIIRAYSETLLDEAAPEDETAHRYLPRIISEVDRLSSITQDLLILSAAESNPVRKQVCDFAEVFLSVMAQMEVKADEKHLRLEYDGPDHFTIEANPSQLYQVALNLVDNAVKYTANGTVSVKVEREGDQAVVAVKDTGIGIPSDQVSRVFERFYRVDKGRSRATGGTGLGLSIVKHIVEAHGGSVTVQSALNRGSTFTVRLPIGDTDRLD